MSQNDQSNRVWFDSLLPKIIANLDESFRDAEYELSVPADSFYLSNTYYVKIRPKCATEKVEKSISIVVKRPSDKEVIRELIQSDRQFHNEILFYRLYARGSEDFPRSVYLEEKPPCDSVIALENVSNRGYELCSSKYDVPLEYTLAAMREIGRFHGRGYVMKHRNRKEFFNIVNQIQETRYEITPESRLRSFVNEMSTWAIDYLRKKNYDQQFCDILEDYLSHAFENVMLKSAEPVEPLCTLCHGDFTMNNTLFKKENGEYKAMLLDFALMRYGSPAIDLSTFFCLSCPKQLKKPEFDLVLRTYHDALVKYLAEHNIVDDTKYSYEALYNDHKERGLFGFLIASFYLANHMGYSVTSPEDVMRLDPKESAAITREAGGDKVGEILATMLLDLKELGCLDHVLRITDSC